MNVENKHSIEEKNTNSTQVPSTDRSCQVLEEWFQEKLISKFGDSIHKEISDKTNNEVREEKSPIKLNDEQMDCLNLSMDSTSSAFTNSQLDFIATINETALLEKKLDFAERELEKVIENIQQSKELKKTVSCSQVLEKIEEEKSESTSALDKPETNSNQIQVNAILCNKEPSKLNQFSSQKTIPPIELTEIENDCSQESFISFTEMENTIISARISHEENDTILGQSPKKDLKDVSDKILFEKDIEHSNESSVQKSLNTDCSKTSLEENMDLRGESFVKKKIDDASLEEKVEHLSEFSVKTNSDNANPKISHMENQAILGDSLVLNNSNEASSNVKNLDEGSVKTNLADASPKISLEENIDLSSESFEKKNFKDENKIMKTTYINQTKKDKNCSVQYSKCSSSSHEKESQSTASVKKVSLFF